jgi:hypothetical protein
MSAILYWIVVGLIAGWLAGGVMKGAGYGVVVDIILGILGGIWVVRNARHFCRRQCDWQYRRGICRSCDFGMVAETSLTYGRICMPSGVSRFTPMKQIAPAAGGRRASAISVGGNSVGCAVCPSGQIPLRGGRALEL